MFFSLFIVTPTFGATAPEIPYWHVYVDRAGKTHQVRCAFSRLELKSVGPGVTPQWLETLGDQVEKVSVTTQPVGWVGDWHENPGPQWIIPLAGRWFVETHDGQRIEMGPGEMSLGEDQNSKPDALNHRGHLSGTVGSSPATLMIVSLKAKPDVDRPCRRR